jgi:hypothetical protein
MICTLHQILFASANQGDGQGVWHVLDTGEARTGSWWGDMRQRDHLEDLDVDGRIILK